jgi:hypothetical protein
MAGRSKEKGKPVENLTPDELRRELARCRTLAEVYGNSVAAKGLRKRLLKIERRVREEQRLD